MTDAALFKPLKIGEITLKNRVILAPLTRIRATFGTHVPTDLMTEYYAQRASGGLLISEATMVTEGQSSFKSEPGLYNQTQVDAWRKVTDAVHAKGGLIFAQLYHGGRSCCPLNSEGNSPVAPSAIRLTQHQIGEAFNPTGQKVDYAEPRALTKEEIKVVINDFITAAKNSIAAGFDGVEIHGANGYLIDEFWRSSANQRTDEYGGSQENRTRFMLEIVDGIIAAIGASRVAIRLSPINSYQEMKDEDPLNLLAYTLDELSKRNLAFVHVMRSDFFQAQTGDVLGTARKHYKGPIVANMGYTPEEAEAAIASGAIDAVAFGQKFLANPDLPERIKAGAPLNPPDYPTFYGEGAKGYTDYPALA